MTIKLAMFTLPSGKSAFRVDCSGMMTSEDGREIRKVTNKGGKYAGLPEIAVVHENCELTAEFRESIVRRDETAQAIPLAVVVRDRSGKVRMASKFIVEVEKVSYRFFDTEEQAIAWLDTVASPPSSK